MSLINDALKRTQQTTQTQLPPRLDELELHPLEPIHPAQQHDGSGAKRILWIVVMLVVTGNIALWLMFKDRGAKDQVEARTARTELTEPAVTEPEPQPVQAVVEAVTPTPAASAHANQSAGASAGTQGLDASLAEQPPAVELQRPNLKLSTIVSHPVRPSAMINNRVLFVGDRVEGYTVTVIGKDEVTLTKGDDELVITLP